MGFALIFFVKFFSISIEPLLSEPIAVVIPYNFLSLKFKLVLIFSKVSLDVTDVFGFLGFNLFLIILIACSFCLLFWKISFFKFSSRVVLLHLSLIPFPIIVQHFEHRRFTTWSVFEPSFELFLSILQLLIEDNIGTCH